MKNVKVVRILFQIKGNVTLKNLPIFPAPSKSAASYKLDGIFAIPAMYITI